MASTSAIVYEGSPLIVPDGTPEAEDTVSTYLPTARPGSRAPHVWLEDGSSILDLFGKGFVLLRFGADPPAVDGLREAARARDMPLRVVDIVHPEAQRLYQRRLVLVRPDGQSAWRADVEPADALGIIDVVRGAAPASRDTATRAAEEISGGVVHG